MGLWELGLGDMNQNRNFSSVLPAEPLGGKIMNWIQLLFGRGQDQLGNSFRTLIDRKARERRQSERQFAECRMKKYRFEARKSCVADARSYRVASHQFKRWLRAIAQ